jgi:hypothetical protein
MRGVVELNEQRGGEFLAGGCGAAASPPLRTSGNTVHGPSSLADPSPLTWNHAHFSRDLRRRLSFFSAFTMLDTFEVLTTSGVVLWSRTYAPVGANVINSLIRDVFIEERIIPQPEDAGSKPTYKKEGYTLKWTASKDLGLIFVVRNTNRDIILP